MPTITHPNFSVDCVIFGYDFEKLNVLLVERSLEDKTTGENIFTDFTLTGNHVFLDEDLKDAAFRILEDLTGLQNIYLEQLGAFGHPDRIKKKRDRQWVKSIGLDPESRVITVGYYALLNCDQVHIVSRNRKVSWFPVEDVKSLAYDHGDILKAALAALRQKISFLPLAFELLPEKFTLSQLQKLFEVVLNTTLDKRNFRKKLLKLNYLVPLDEKQIGVSHKPGRLYAFSKELYERSNTDPFSIMH